MKGKVFWLGLLPAMLALAWNADAEASHGGLFWAFTALNIGLLVLMRVTTVSWFYGFLTGFFVLGCWFKVMVHHIADYPYVEPIGNFFGSSVEWQEYYLFAGAMGLAIMFARLISLMFSSSLDVKEENYTYSAGAVTLKEWTVLIIASLIFYIINNIFAFFVTGVDSKVILPLGFNAPIAFMALIGVAVVVAAFVARDLQVRGGLHFGVVIALLLITSVGSVSMASRAGVVMQSVPILIGAYYLQANWRRVQLSLWPLLLFVGVVLVVLLVVSLYRIRVFSGFSSGDSEMFSFFLLESGLLVVDRWVGAEAIMVAVAEPTRSFDMFLRLMGESPAVGVDSIYQTLSGGKYEFLQGLTFLTLPGYFGVIGLQGNAFGIFFFVLLMTLLGLAYEGLIKRLLYGQIIPVVLICAAVANALTQLSFPKLLLPFLFQMTVLVWLLGLYMKNSMGLFKIRQSVALPVSDSK